MDPHTHPPLLDDVCNTILCTDVFVVLFFPHGDCAWPCVLWAQICHVILRPFSIYVNWYGEFQYNAYQIHAPPPPWIQIAPRDAANSATPVSLSLHTEHQYIQYLWWPRLWVPSDNLGYPYGELRPHSPDGDKDPGCGLMQETPGIRCRVFKFIPHRCRQHAGGYDNGHKGEAVGMGHRVHTITSTKRGELHYYIQITVHPPYWRISPLVHPLTPTGPKGGAQPLPGEGPHPCRWHEHGSQLATKPQEPTCDQLSGLPWVGGPPQTFQSTSAVPP